MGRPLKPALLHLLRPTARKDLLIDIRTEELSHLEIIGSLARLHLRPTKKLRDAAEADPL